MHTQLSCTYLYIVKSTCTSKQLTPCCTAVIRQHICLQPLVVITHSLHTQIADLTTFEHTRKKDHFRLLSFCPNTHFTHIRHPFAENTAPIYIKHLHKTHLHQAFITFPIYMKIITHLLHPFTEASSPLYPAVMLELAGWKCDP